MFCTALLDSPPETFQEMLWRLEMTEEEYYKYLDDVEEAKISAYFPFLLEETCL